MHTNVNPISYLLPSVSEGRHLLESLVTIESRSGHEHEIQAFIASWLAELSIDVQMQATSDGLVNVIGRLPGSRPGKRLMLMGHCDTVAPADGWATDPLAPHAVGSRLVGLGAMDMKAGLAAAMLTMRALAGAQDRFSGELVFASLADEEAQSRGARALIEQGAVADAALVCEPHFDDPLLGAVGKMNLHVAVSGKTAHGSYPDRGVNAVVEAGHFLSALDGLRLIEHSEIGQGSQCVLRIRGGPDDYQVQVPDRCSMLINWHTVPGESAESVTTALRDLVRIIGSDASFEFQAMAPYYPPFITSAQEPFVKLFGTSYREQTGREPQYRYGRGVSDANLVSDAWRIPTIVFGPSGGNMHTANEWADLDQLQQSVAVYLATATKFLC